MADKSAARPRRLPSHSLDSQQSSRRVAREELERETGIEPATNSLEGCDSTTELLPLISASPPLRRVSRAGPGELRKMVERGGFEPPKDEVRQIYSLLLLAAQQSLHTSR